MGHFGVGFLLRSVQPKRQKYRAGDCEGVICAHRLQPHFDGGHCTHLCVCVDVITTGVVYTLANAQYTPPARHDKTVLSVSRLVFRRELDDCSERVHTSNFLSATVLSCRESNSHRQSETDKTVLSCLAWRCELASIQRPG